MENPSPTVYLVDDDPDVLKAIERLIESVGLRVATFPSPGCFLTATTPTLRVASCSTSRCQD